MGIFDEFKPTAGQTKALDMIDRLVVEPEPSIRRINGPAGTGKTTTLRRVVENIGDSIILTPTGKAASRVTEATGLYACTIHRYLYKPVVNKKTGEMTFEMREPAELGRAMSKTVIVDEGSMLTKKRLEDLCNSCEQISHNLVLVGDERQLPPVPDDADDETDFSVFRIDLGEMVTLDEVKRQKDGSRVLDAATFIRNGEVERGLSLLPTIEVGDLIDTAAMITVNGGGVICHRNQTRHFLNSQLRRAFGMEGELKRGERLMVTKNNYSLDWYNGETVIFEELISQPEAWEFDRQVRDTVFRGPVHFALARVSGEKVIICTEEIYGTTGTPEFVLKAEMLKWARKNLHGFENPEFGFVSFPILHANLGWSLTCHKAQGSQYDNVLVVLEPSVDLRRDDGIRWLYTAVTRAVKTVEIVRLRSTKYVTNPALSYQVPEQQERQPVLLLGDLDSSSHYQIANALKSEILLANNAILATIGVGNLEAAKLALAPYQALVLGRGLDWHRVKHLFKAAKEIKKPLFYWSKDEKKIVHYVEEEATK